MVPLPPMMTELPRLPSHEHLSGKDYLGLSVLSLAMAASPALKQVWGKHKICVAGESSSFLAKALRRTGAI